METPSFASSARYAMVSRLSRTTEVHRFIIALSSGRDPYKACETTFSKIAHLGLAKGSPWGTCKCHTVTGPFNACTGTGGAGEGISGKPSCFTRCRATSGGGANPVSLVLRANSVAINLFLSGIRSPCAVGEANQASTAPSGKLWVAKRVPNQGSVVQAVPGSKKGSTASSTSSSPPPSSSSSSSSFSDPEFFRRPGCACSSFSPLPELLSPPPLSSPSPLSPISLALLAAAE
mmetsp:Transcript_53182/g.116693  ORF Transcript_53182/g.116693 Transcript_53182/m.116693 type:complete len:233 (+) Transcript_53182:1162-1860(+)